MLAVSAVRASYRVACARSSDLPDVALAHGVNANIVHRWMREQADTLLPAPQNEFVALNVPRPVEQVTATETSSPPGRVRFTLRFGAVPA